MIGSLDKRQSFYSSSQGPAASEQAAIPRKPRPIPLAQLSTETRERLKVLNLCLLSTCTRPRAEPRKVWSNRWSVAMAQSCQAVNLRLQAEWNCLVRY